MLCTRCHELDAREDTARGPRCGGCAEELLPVPALRLAAPAVAIPAFPRGWTHYQTLARGAALAQRVGLARRAPANEPRGATRAA